MSKNAAPLYLSAKLAVTTAVTVLSNEVVSLTPSPVWDGQTASRPRRCGLVSLIMASVTLRGLRAAKAQGLERLARIDPVVKRNDRVFEFLVGLMALARDQHRVAGPGHTQNSVDGPFAVQLDAVSVAANPAKAFVDRRRDFFRRFPARIVARDEREIGQLGGNRAHFRTFARITISAATKRQQQPAGSDFAESVQHVAQRVVGMRVIDEHAEGLAERDGFEAAGHGLQ